MADKFLRQPKGRTVLGLESFESIPETSRRSVESLLETCTWAIWRGTMQFGEPIWTSSHLLVGLVVYLHAKFEELNLRINETRSSENRSRWLPPSQVQYPRFCILPIIWLSDPFPKFPMASRIIMDNSLHVSSALLRPREIKWPQPHTLKLSLNRKIH